MTKNQVNALRWVLLGLILLSFTSCTNTQTQVSIPPAGEDAPPEISVNAIPVTPTGPGNAGDIEKQKVTSTTVSNVDIGTEAQFIVNAINGAPPKTTGGVKSLSVTITQAGATTFQGSATGAPDSSGKVPNSLFITKTSSNAAITVTINSATVLTAVATNFNGQSNTVTVTYIPLDPAQRKKDLQMDVILDKAFGLNTYTGTVPKPTDLPVNGFLKFLNGGPLAAPTILMFKDEPTSKCLDPTVTIILNSGGNLNSGDLTKLFGSETPEFSDTPIKVVACANPAGGFPAHLQLRATYQLR